jgi:hypothetical protein
VNPANSISPFAFETFSAPLIGLPITRIWQGYGSAIFLEFGNVQPRRRRDGSPGNPRGEMTLMLERGWRIEGKRRIWCGSWSDGERWPRAFSRLEGASVASASLLGRLPEVSLGLSNGLWVLSMTTQESDPDWTLFQRKDEESVAMYVRAGRLRVDGDLPDSTS